jgi:threonine dehydrogenase-like Zn-dependent dehydrogenase
VDDPPQLRPRDVRVRAALSGIRHGPRRSPERWLFVSLGMVALVATHDARVKVGDHVAVFGLGAIEPLVVPLARMAGAAGVTGWLDAHPDEAINVALTYDDPHPQ